MSRRIRPQETGHGLERALSGSTAAASHFLECALADRINKSRLAQCASLYFEHPARSRDSGGTGYYILTKSAVNMRMELFQSVNWDQIQNSFGAMANTTKINWTMVAAARRAGATIEPLYGLPLPSADQALCSDGSLDRDQLEAHRTLMGLLNTCLGYMEPPAVEDALDRTRSYLTTRCTQAAKDAYETGKALANAMGAAEGDEGDGEDKENEQDEPEDAQREDAQESDTESEQRDEQVEAATVAQATVAQAEAQAAGAQAVVGTGVAGAHRCRIGADAALDALLGEGSIIAAIAVAARPSGLFASRSMIREAIAGAQPQGTPLPRKCPVCQDPWAERSPPCLFACVHNHLVCAHCVSSAAQRGAATVDDETRPVRSAWRDPPMGKESCVHSRNMCLASRLIPCPACELSSGLKWRNIGSNKPSTGTLLRNSDLASGLASMTEFTPDEWEFTQDAWDKFGITGLRTDHYIESNKSYFRPAEPLHKSPTPDSTPDSTPASVFSTVTAWSWVDESRPVDVGLQLVEVADLPSGNGWRLLREDATCRLDDDKVGGLISCVLREKGIDEDAFWSTLAQEWALEVQGGDVRRARRFGLGRNPGQPCLRQVSNPTFYMLLREVPGPRTEDVIARRLLLEDGRGSGPQV